DLSVNRFLLNTCVSGCLTLVIDFIAALVILSLRDIQAQRQHPFCVYEINHFPTGLNIHSS
ncbi:MAG TPA: hypothetical protein VJ799_00195, partial [Nitrososphaeraceae archaeon]|nr:hypothetical protein [Nitrososphaeraceae archaeon]